MKTNEIFLILLAVIVSAFVVSFRNLSLEKFIFSALFFIVIFIFSIGAKKLASNYLQCGVETKIWSFQRYGWYERSYFKTPIPIGIILPFILSILSLGYVPWLATTQTEITASKSKVAKRHGIYRYSEMTDLEAGWISASGIFVCLILAVISYFVGLSDLSRYSIIFAAFGMLPLGNLDGTKILIGNRVLWAVLAVLCIVGVSYVFLLV